MEDFKTPKTQMIFRFFGLASGILKNDIFAGFVFKWLKSYQALEGGAMQRKTGSCASNESC